MNPFISRLAKLQIFALILGSSVASAALTDPPNLLHHNNVTRANAIWEFTGTTYQATHVLDSNDPGDELLRMAGAGDLNGDGIRDIVWQHETRDELRVWYMNSNGTVASKGSLNPSSVGLPGWRIVGVQDFNNDGIADLLWEYLGYLHCIWYMQPPGTLNHFFNFNTKSLEPGLDWRIDCAADLAGLGPAIVWKWQPVNGAYPAGLVSFWYNLGNIENGQVTAAPLQNVYNQDLLLPDLDFQFVSAQNVSGQTHMLMHHRPTGINGVWFLTANVMTSGAFLTYPAYPAEPPPWYDPDWKIAGQNWTPSVAPLNYGWSSSTPGQAYGTALQTTIGGSGITITAVATLDLGETMTVSRREPPELNWTQLGPSQSSPSFLDTTAQSGHTYEYWAAFSTGRPEGYIKCSILRPATALENRGTIVVLTDNSLALDTVYNNQVLPDLVADGWSVVRFSAPRHAFDANYRANLNSISNNIKSTANAKGILIIGHVTIPYSGASAADGHANHQGAWPADMWFGSTDAGWTDSSVSYTNPWFPDNSNVSGDGKFDQDSAPGSNPMKLFVGRVDFANLPGQDEVSLIQRYFEKVHHYRVSDPPWDTVPSKGVVYDALAMTQPFPYFGDDGCSVYENATRNYRAFSQNGVSDLVLGDPFAQKSSMSYIWGFFAGKGWQNIISQDWPDYPPRASLQHTSEDIYNLYPGGKEAQIGFYLLLGSYFGDWNMSDSFLRAAISTPTYGLAAAWIGASAIDWRFTGLGLGDTLGECATATVNNRRSCCVVADMGRTITIMGEPTLRMAMFRPPSGLQATRFGSQALLTWTCGASADNYVYKGPTANGPFIRALQSPVSGCSATDPSFDTNNPYYMVRGVQTVATGCGSYSNLSLGCVVLAQ